MAIEKKKKSLVASLARSIEEEEKAIDRRFEMADKYFNQDDSGKLAESNPPEKKSHKNRSKNGISQNFTLDVSKRRKNQIRKRKIVLPISGWAIRREVFDFRQQSSKIVKRPVRF